MLIYDLGFHNGDDTDYYLKKGCQVVAVEANPELCKAGINRFSDAILEQKLFLLQAAFHHQMNSVVKFYVNPSYSDWGTCVAEQVSYWKEDENIINVPTVNLNYLLNTYGKPYYIKTDIEKLDYIVLMQLQDEKYRPPYLSLELSRFDYFKTFSYLYILGYKQFKLINQLAHQRDEKLDYDFGQYHSGMFGEDLTGWVDFDTCLTQYMKYKEMKAIDNKNLALGWIDIHAKYNID